MSDGDADAKAADKNAEDEEKLVDKIQNENIPDASIQSELKSMSHKPIEHHRVFNPTKDLPENFFVLMYGMRRCGKSTTLNYMLYSMRNRLKNYRVYLFSSTAKVDPGQYKYFPKEHQFHDLEMLDEELGHIIEEQQEIMDLDDEAEREKAQEENRVLVVMDDCVNEQTIRTSKNLGHMAVAGRHTGVSVIILSQCVAGSGSVPPIVRTQADAIIMCTLPRSVRERELIHEQYLTAEDSNKNKDKSRALMENITSVQYRNMVVAMWDTSARRSREFVMTYGPVPKDGVPKDFKLGDPKQWEEESEESDGGDGASVNMSDAEDDGDDNENVGHDARTKHGDAIHGGGLKNRGIVKASQDLKKVVMRQLESQPAEDTTNYLPPAFSTGKDPRQFRSFVQYSGSGARETVPTESYKYEIDGIWEEQESSNRLQGQRFMKPDRPGKKMKRISKHKSKKRVAPYSSLMKRAAGVNRAKSSAARQGSAYAI